MENPLEVFARVEKQVYILRNILNTINTLSTQMAYHVNDESNESVRQKFREWYLSHSIQDRDLIIKSLYDCKLNILKQTYAISLEQTPQNLFTFKLFELNAANDLENIILLAYIDQISLQREYNRIPEIKQNSRINMQSFAIPAQYIPTLPSSLLQNPHISATQALLDEYNDVTAPTTSLAPGLRPEHIVPEIPPMSETHPRAQVITNPSVGSPAEKKDVDDSLDSQPIFDGQDQQKNKRKYAGISRFTPNNNPLVFHTYSSEKLQCGKCGAFFNTLIQTSSASEKNKLCSRCRDIERNVTNKSVCPSTESTQPSNNNKTFTLESEISDHSLEMRSSVNVDTATSSIPTTDISTYSSLFTKPAVASTLSLSSRKVLRDTPVTSPISDLTESSRTGQHFEDPLIISDASNSSLSRPG